MITFEIWIDGNKICLAGHEQAISLHASLALPPGAAMPHFAVTGMIQSQATLIEDHSWVACTIPISSEVLIKVVDSMEPDRAAELRSLFGTRLHPSYKELFCSFCGRSQKDVRHLCEGIGGNICDECVETCQESISAKAEPT